MQYLILCAFFFWQFKKKYPILKPIINGPKDMEDLKKWKWAQDMNDKEIVFSKSIKAGKRIYYLDVKKNRKMKCSWLLQRAKSDNGRRRWFSS